MLVPARSYMTSTSAVNFVRLDPALVAVSCDEIKSAILKDLSAADHWKGVVRVMLHPVRDQQEPIYLTSVRNPAGWHYRLEMPDQVERTRFIGAVVNAVLAEMANRNAVRMEGELPPWLVAGLAEHLDATSLSGLTLELQTGVSQKRRNHDPLAKVREYLRNNPALTLDQLDWPSSDPFAAQNDGYRYCSHLLVHELLRLKDGRTSLLRLIENAHDHLNWQTTFFTVFARQFPRLIDLDKWWTMRVVQLSHGEELSRFKPDEALRQLDDILVIRAVAHNNTNQLPIYTTLTFQQVIRDWPWAEQEPLLSERLQQLHSLALRAPASSGRLIDDYRAALAEYLAKRTCNDNSRKNLSSQATLRVKVAIRHLDTLDAEREKVKLRPVLTSSAR